LKKLLFNFLKLAVSLGLGVMLIFWFVNKMTPQQRQDTIDAFKRADYFWIILAPVLGLISNLSRAQRWRQLLEPTGYKPSYWNTYFSVMMMYFFNLFFPRLGEVTRCGMLARYENVPLDKSIGTMVVERVVDLVSIVIIGGLLLAIEYDRLFAFFQENVLNKKPPPETGFDITKYLVVGVLGIAFSVAVFYVQRKYGFAKLKEIIKERLLGFTEGLKSIRYVKNPLEFIFHSVFIWVCYFLMIYLSFPALPETASMSLMAGVACLFFGGFAMVATPGGIGLYPLALQQVLILYGVNETIGYAFGSVVWAAQVAAVLIGGSLTLILLAILNRPSALNTKPLKS
jgi:uncharacterized membrane protein YbhN (UPF0104 family)